MQGGHPDGTFASDFSKPFWLTQPRQTLVVLWLGLNKRIAAILPCDAGKTKNDKKTKDKVSDPKAIQVAVLLLELQSLLL